MNMHCSITSFCIVLIVCILVDAASVSDDAEHNTQSSKASTVMDFLKLKHTKRDFNAQSTERNRRLIPYMMVYLPTTNRQYVPFVSPYDVNQAVKPYYYKDDAAIAAQQPYNIPIITTAQPATIKSIQRRPIYPNPDNLNKQYANNFTDLHAITLHAQSQQHAPNNYQYVLPVVDVLLPQQRPLQPINNQYNIKTRTENDQNYITPFLTSNQLPGPFIPILSIKNHTEPKPAASVHARQPAALPPNTMLGRAPISLSIQQLPRPSHQHAAETEKPIYIFQQNAQQLPPNYLPGQYFEVVPTTEPPITSNIIDEPTRLNIEPVKVKPPSLPKRYQTILLQNSQFQNTAAHSSINYELDPDDGYSGKVLPYDQPYIPRHHSSNKNVLYRPTLQYQLNSDNSNKYAVQQTAIEPSHITSTTIKPINKFGYKNKPATLLDETTFSEPYSIPITTQTVHQHLTETTQNLPKHTRIYPTTTMLSARKPIAHDSIHSPLNTIANYRPDLMALNNFISTSSENPNDDISNHLNTTSLQSLLHKLQDANYLPKTLSVNNLDNSMRTLAKVLHDLKKSQKLAKPPPKPIKYHSDELHVHRAKPTPGPQSGTPGVDYPNYSEIPATSFNCSEQRYKGFFGDPETECQVWHYCDLNGGQASFLCPNGTIFSQVLLTCDWWFNVKCSTTAQLYVLNERLYKYIIPLSPKFPEDYSGPLVDKYLAIKFQEMEEKMQREKNRNRIKDDGDDVEEDDTETGPPESTTIEMNNDNAYEIDDDGQMHSFDSAVQLNSNTNFDEETDAKNEFGIQDTSSETDNGLILTSPYEPIANNHRHFYQTTTYAPVTLQSLPPPPRVHVESERAEVVEISSDGSSGHLIPGRHKRGFLIH